MTALDLYFDENTGLYCYFHPAGGPPLYIHFDGTGWVWSASGEPVVAAVRNVGHGSLANDADLALGSVDDGMRSIGGPFFE